MITTTQRLETVSGEVVEFELGAPADIDSFFVFCLHKSGSTLLNTMLAELCEIAGVPIFEPEVLEFQNGFPLGTWKEDIQSLFFERGYCFSGFRFLPPYLKGFDISRFKKVLLVRDPRDMMVSHYFSHKTSHSIPQGKLGSRVQALRDKVEAMEIDEYVLWASKNARAHFNTYQEYIADDKLRVFRYEDVIFEKRRWLRELLEFVGIQIDDQDVRRIADKHDIRPEVEDERKHVRRVTPGDHQEKLKTETIEELNGCFAEVLDRFGYAA